jgi:hypothetical protein
MQSARCRAAFLGVLLGLLGASSLWAGTAYNFESCAAGVNGSGQAIGVWNGAPPAGCDGWYTPPPSVVPGTAAASVYAYNYLQGSPYGFTADPAGGNNVLGLTGGSAGAVERAQHDFAFSPAGEWSVGYDLSETNLSSAGNSFGADYIGSFSAWDVNKLGSAFTVLGAWENATTSSTWASTYYVYDANGNALNPNGVSPGAAWTGLDQSDWYHESAIFDENSNQIVAVAITDLTTGATTTVDPTGWYMAGGAGAQAPLNAFRFAGLGQSNALLVDNVEVGAVAPEPATLLLMGLGFAATIALRRRIPR